MKSMAAELNMYHAQVNDYKDEIERLKRLLAQQSQQLANAQRAVLASAEAKAIAKPMAMAFSFPFRYLFVTFPLPFRYLSVTFPLPLR